MKKVIRELRNKARIWNLADIVDRIEWMRDELTGVG
jgi:hypothetical protein